MGVERALRADLGHIQYLDGVVATGKVSGGNRMMINAKMAANKPMSEKIFSKEVAPIGSMGVGFTRRNHSKRALSHIVRAEKKVATKAKPTVVSAPAEPPADGIAPWYGQDPTNRGSFRWSTQRGKFDADYSQFYHPVAFHISLAVWSVLACTPSFPQSWGKPLGIAFTESIFRLTAQFPRGPEMMLTDPKGLPQIGFGDHMDPFWFQMFWWHYGLFLFLFFGQIGWAGRKLGYFSRSIQALRVKSAFATLDTLAALGADVDGTQAGPPKSLRSPGKSLLDEDQFT